MEILNNQSPLQISFSDYANLFWDDRLMKLKSLEQKVVEKVRQGLIEYGNRVKEVIERTSAACQEELELLTEKLQSINPNFRFVFRNISNDNTVISQRYYRYLEIADYKKNELNPLEEMSQEEWDEMPSDAQSEWTYHKAGLNVRASDFLQVFNIDIEKFCTISQNDSKKLTKLLEELVSVHQKKLREITNAMGEKAKEEFVSKVRMSVLETELDSDNTIATKFVAIKEKLAQRANINTNFNLLTDGATS